MTIIIPSHNIDNLCKCLRSWADFDPGHNYVVVWDDDSVPTVVHHGLLIEGEKPFIFSRNINIGIRAAGDDDVLLLNDDALLKTPSGFTQMAEACKRVGWGLMGPLTNSTGNPDQLYPGRRFPLDSPGPWQTERTVPFLCAFIPRSTIDAVGLLDERFTEYGFEDQDYCRRVRNAGLKLGIYGGCFVDHLTLPSTFRGPGGVSGDLEAGRRIYIDKWGDDGI